jgi:hypothetical protein
MTNHQPIRLTRRGELVMGFLSAFVALVLFPLSVTAFIALLMVTP